MAEYVDEKVQDGNVLLEVVRKYKNELAELMNSSVILRGKYMQLLRKIQHREKP